MTQWAQSGSPALRERVRAALATGSVEAIVAVDNLTVRETAEGWFTPRGRSPAT